MPGEAGGERSAAELEIIAGMTLAEAQEVCADEGLPVGSGETLASLQEKLRRPQHARDVRPGRAAVHRNLPGVAFNHEGQPVCSAEEFDEWCKDEFASLRERYSRRVDNFRRAVGEGVEASEAGGVGVVFLLQHYEHPLGLCEIIERRYPTLRFVILTMNLVSSEPEPGW